MKFDMKSLRAELLFFSLASILCLASSSAQATDVFGERGQGVVGGASGVGVGWKHLYKTDTQSARDSGEVVLTPVVGMFIGKNVLLSVEVDASAKFDKDVQDQVTLGGGPKLGYNIDLGRGVSLLPAVRASYSYQFYSTDIEDGGHRIDVGIEAPFYFQVVKHGALTFGPAASQILTQGGATRVGLVGGVVLWI